MMVLLQGIVFQACSSGSARSAVAQGASLRGRNSKMVATLFRCYIVKTELLMFLLKIANVHIWFRFAYRRMKWFMVSHSLSKQNANDVKQWARTASTLVRW